MRSPQTNDQWLGTSPVDECLIRATLWEPQRAEAAGLAGLAALPGHRRCRRCSRMYFCNADTTCLDISRFFFFSFPGFLLRSSFAQRAVASVRWEGNVTPPPLASLLARARRLFPALPSCPPFSSVRSGFPTRCQSRRARELIPQVCSCLPSFLEARSLALCLARSRAPAHAHTWRLPCDSAPGRGERETQGKKSPLLKPEALLLWRSCPCRSLKQGTGRGSMFFLRNSAFLRLPAGLARGV